MSNDGTRGKARLLSDDNLNFFGEVFARTDCGNDGLSRKEAINTIIQFNPDISRAAARNQHRHRILPNNTKAGLLKKTTQKVQATTSDQTNITVAQQYC